MKSECKQDCKHKAYCKLSPQDIKACKVATPVNDLIFGRTFEEIRKMQQGCKLKRR